ncbi:hypothetical protein GCM10022403_033460 [Streptomyces coacervatus]|uniref:Uncharacterized protein n=1 Tax=Streptomyces coacervatus TaxID=647381 RepID=A0ABP7HJJ3_9ACTN|nr:hypothetical protein [Streptomyces coacervatus]MDF2272325.1 hypothetical protein [Streptomyces coacervatus]
MSRALVERAGAGSPTVNLCTLPVGSVAGGLVNVIGLPFLLRSEIRRLRRGLPQRAGDTPLTCA